MEALRLSEPRCALFLGCLLGCGGGAAGSSPHDAAPRDAPPTDARAVDASLHPDGGAGGAAGDAAACTVPGVPQARCRPLTSPYAASYVIDDFHLSTTERHGLAPLAGVYNSLNEPRTRNGEITYVIAFESDPTTPAAGAALSAAYFRIFVTEADCHNPYSGSARFCGVDWYFNGADTSPINRMQGTATGGRFSLAMPPGGPFLSGFDGASRGRPDYVDGQRLEGMIAADGRTLSGMRSTGRYSIHTFAKAPSPLQSTQSTLDFVVNWPAGAVQPDVDVDGDGLETLAADASGRASLCKDGNGQWLNALGTDGQPIPDPSCPMRPEMADAYSFIGEAHAVRADVVGLFTP